MFRSDIGLLERNATLFSWRSPKYRVIFPQNGMKLGYTHHHLWLNAINLVDISSAKFHFRMNRCKARSDQQLTMSPFQSEGVTSLFSS